MRYSILAKSRSLALLGITNKRKLHGKLALNQNRKNNAFVLVAVFQAQLVPLFFVARQGILDDLDRRVRRANVFHLNLLAFQLFVVLEKTFQNEQAMRR